MEQTNTTNNYYNVNYPLDYDSMLKYSSYTTDVLKARLKKYLHVKVYNECNLGTEYEEIAKQKANFMVSMVDFMFAYGKKKNVNPIICILQIVHETGWMKNLLKSADGTSYKNLGGIKVNNYIFSGYDRVYSNCDTTDYMHTKYMRWVDCARAIVDRLALYMNNCPCGADNTKLTHLTFDTGHYPSEATYVNKRDLTPTIYNFLGHYSTQPYRFRLAARLNLICTGEILDGYFQDRRSDGSLFSDTYLENGEWSSISNGDYSFLRYETQPNGLDSEIENEIADAIETENSDLYAQTQIGEIRGIIAKITA